MPGTETLTSAGSRDAYVAKYTTNGDYVWANAIGGGTIQDFGYSLDLNSDDEPVVCGYFSGTAAFDPGPCGFVLTSKGGQDAYIAGYDKDGFFRWARQIGGATNNECLSIAIDTSTENLYVTGYFTGTADFDPSLSNLILTSSGDRDIHIAKYDLSCPDPVEFEITVNLQGPYNGMLMKMDDGIRSTGFIPGKEPYTRLGFYVSENGQGCLEAGVLTDQLLTDDDIVDWVYVGIRSSIGAFLTSRAGLLKRDGSIVNPDGTPFTLKVEQGDYQVRIAHRNHLSIISADLVSVSN